MRVEQQGRNECMLATIAALSDRPLAEVRSYACGLGGVRVWSRIFNTRARTRTGKPTFWAVINKTATHFGGDPLMKTVYGLGISGLVGAVHRDLPATGRGVVRLKRKSGRGSGHIIPFENGLVYEPASAHPEVGVTLREYLTFNPRLRLDFVRVYTPEVSATMHSNPESNPMPTPDLGY